MIQTTKVVSIGCSTRPRILSQDGTSFYPHPSLKCTSGPRRCAADKAESYPQTALVGLGLPACSLQRTARRAGPCGAHIAWLGR